MDTRTLGVGTTRADFRLLVRDRAEEYAPREYQRTHAISQTWKGGISRSSPAFASRRTLGPARGGSVSERRSAASGCPEGMTFRSSIASGISSCHDPRDLHNARPRSSLTVSLGGVLAFLTVQWGASGLPSGFRCPGC